MKAEFLKRSLGRGGTRPYPPATPPGKDEFHLVPNFPSAPMVRTSSTSSPISPWGCLLLLAALLMFGFTAQADDDFIYAVQLSAVVQTSPAQISLSWPTDPYGASNYIVYRKAKSDTSWGSGTTFPASTTSYVDNNVAVGGTYEYQVLENALSGRRAYGYIFAGINAPLTEGRGKLLLIVATNSTVGLDTEMARLQSDLTGDGWMVIRHDVSSNDTPASVKSLILADYNADPANVNMVFLFGHVPTLQSGDLNYDGHLARPMPADAYYADMNGDWSGDPDFLPTDVELMIGRVDLANLTGDGGTITWPSETELLRNYLNKDHNWRHKVFTVPRRALMGDLRGEEGGEATAASGWRNFDPLVGHGNTTTANTDATDDQGNPINPTNRWDSILSSNTFLIAYGCGAGQPDACSGLGTSDGDFLDMRSKDVYAGDLKAPFIMLFGSWFGEWDYTDDLLRSVLATPTMGLEAWMAGRPHWFIHHVGLGETFGYSTRLNMNNSTLYQNNSNALTRAIYIAMMGDPSLRLDPVGPAANFTAMPAGSTMNLQWSASTDSVVGYHVYRASNASEPFTRITSSPITGTSYSDTGLGTGNYTYMVRAIKLQSTPSGTYYNPSQGMFATASISVTVPPMTLAVTRVGSAVQLSWNSLVGLAYHVQAKTNLTQVTWADVTGPITATNATTTWKDTTTSSSPQKWYRVSSP